jgi:hypothetical protein
VYVAKTEQIAAHFKTFMEDYNTATMPHEKFYNYERWEMQEYQRKKLEEEQEARGHRAGGSSSSSSSSGLREATVFNDEEIRRKELKEAKMRAEHAEFLALKQKMGGNKEVQERMRHQAQLSTELQLAFKRGDAATVKRLERILAPDEMKATVKHPWA